MTGIVGQHDRNGHDKSIMAFSNVATLIRIHMAGYISLKDLLALHNQKKERGKKTSANPDLFTPS